MHNMKRDNCIDIKKTKQLVLDTKSWNRSLIEKIREIDYKLEKRILRYEKSINKEEKKQEKKNGKILHLDGDKRYSEKAYRYYKRIGVDAVVKNIPEEKQAMYVIRLIQIHTPDILIITGHDLMYNKKADVYNLKNYKNSRHFINTVLEARRYDLLNNINTVIYAGACQSYYEALISAGANFASSPGRILIDFLDPLIVAEKIAKTERAKFVTINDIVHELRDGRMGIDGIGASGRRM